MTIQELKPTSLELSGRQKHNSFLIFLQVSKSMLSCFSDFKFIHLFLLTRWKHVVISSTPSQNCLLICVYVSLYKMSLTIRKHLSTMYMYLINCVRVKVRRKTLLKTRLLMKTILFGKFCQENSARLKYNYNACLKYINNYRSILFQLFYIYGLIWYIFLNI
jgi:hypothetical protein